MKLQPPDTSYPTNTPRPNRGLLYLIAVFGVINAALLLLWIFYIKAPGVEETSQSQQTHIAPDAGSSLEEKSLENQPDTLDPGKAQAEAALAQWLQLQAQAEAMSVKAWADTAYEEALASALEGDGAYEQNQFADAAAAYEQAAAIMNKTIADKDMIVLELLQAGEAALQDGLGLKAAETFSRVLVAEPGNTTALKGKQRAESAKRVLELVERASSDFQRGELSAAKVLVDEAMQLDPENSKAKALLGSINKALHEQAFQGAMTTFFDALGNNNFNEANKALVQARQLKPQSKAVADGAALLQAKKKATAIRALEQMFYQKAEAEKWDEAELVIQKAFALDAQAGFAVQNKEMVKQRNRLDERLQDILANPLRLQDQSHFQAATALLAYAEGLGPQGPRLTAQKKELSTLLTAARREVKVRLFSDNQSAITVFKVGRLGTFNQKEMKLFPGKYTIVGQRAGFRDVRKTLIIPITGAASVTMTIQCEERI